MTDNGGDAERQGRRMALDGLKRLGQHVTMRRVLDATRPAKAAPKAPEEGVSGGPTLLERLKALKGG